MWGNNRSEPTADGRRLWFWETESRSPGLEKHKRWTAQGLTRVRHILMTSGKPPALGISHMLHNWREAGGKPAVGCKFLE